MDQLCQLFCCCFYSEEDKTPQQRNSARNNTNNPNRNKDKKPKPQPKPSRIISKYKPQEIIQIKKQQRNKQKVVYTCPICTLYFNKILACDQCENNMCRKCVQSYENKFTNSSKNMKCPFCNSQASHYIDYENQAKSYFDTTGKNGFLDPIQRGKIDEQMKWNGSKYLDSGENNNKPLQVIQQQAIGHGQPSNRNLSHVEQYHQIIVQRHEQSENILGRRQNNLSNDESSMVHLNPGLQNTHQNPGQSDLSFIQQYQIRTAEHQIHPEQEI